MKDLVRPTIHATAVVAVVAASLSLSPLSAHPLRAYACSTISQYTSGPDSHGLNSGLHVNECNNTASADAWVSQGYYHYTVTANLYKGDSSGFNLYASSTTSGPLTDSSTSATTGYLNVPCNVSSYNAAATNETESSGVLTPNVYGWC